MIIKKFDKFRKLYENKEGFDFEDELTDLELDMEDDAAEADDMDADVEGAEGAEDIEAEVDEYAEVKSKLDDLKELVQDEEAQELVDDIASMLDNMGEDEDMEDEYVELDTTSEDLDDQLKSIHMFMEAQ